MSILVSLDDMNYILSKVEYVICILFLLRVDQDTMYLFENIMQQMNYMKCILTGIIASSAKRPSIPTIDLILQSHVSKATVQVFNQVRSSHAKTFSTLLLDEFLQDQVFETALWELNTNFEQKPGIDSNNTLKDIDALDTFLFALVSTILLEEYPKKVKAELKSALLENQPDDKGNNPQHIFVVEEEPEDSLEEKDTPTEMPLKEPSLNEHRGQDIIADENPRHNRKIEVTPTCNPPRTNERTGSKCTLKRRSTIPTPSSWRAGASPPAVLVGRE